MQNVVRDEVGPNFPSESSESCIGGSASATPETTQACSTDNSLTSPGNGPASGAILKSLSLDLSSPDIDLDELAWRPPIEQYQWHRKHNPVYLKWWNWVSIAENLLPNGLMAKYRGRVEDAQAEGREPSIAPDLLLVHDALGKELWEVLREVQRVEELGTREEPRPLIGEAANLYRVLKKRHQKRYKDTMWLDNLRSQSIAFEAENGSVDEARVKQRFERFPFGVFPTLAERNEAEQKAEEGAK